MKGLFLILLLVYVVSATRCIVKDDKDVPEVHVIRLGDRSGESDESDVVTLQIPDTRRKRETHEICKKDTDCTKGEVCVPYLGCIKGHRKDRASDNFTQM
ncbi:uncharacterized protein LOC122720038 [Apis laboriosa]|uniref:uncharacterized protein LOC102678362 n=1 Tax=Apis dorsata TaxID=7462 RepID=UPI0003DF4FC0|nr:uncharacterized protein LOC102678362 [Apis dorsata]XP_043802382.1 uncharacterized protein LOC122720038 [Apis laboriosa]